jgi:2'-5' RNA ligase
MRVFYAITFKQESKEKLAIYRDQLIHHTLNGKFITTNNFHLTLAFIGDIDQSKLSIYKNIIDDLPLSRPSLSVTHVGTFPKKNRAILWLGINENLLLDQLVSNLRLLIDNYNLPNEQRKYQAHITIGRQVLLPHSFENYKLPTFNLSLSSVALMHSHRFNDHLIYEPIYEKFF